MRRCGTGRASGALREAAAPSSLFAASGQVEGPACASFSLLSPVERVQLALGLTRLKRFRVCGNRGAEGIFRLATACGLYN